MPDVKEVPGRLLDDLRGLARKYGAPMVVAGCAEFVKDFAVRGVEAEIEERRGDKSIGCPRCRRRDALLQERGEGGVYLVRGKEGGLGE